jgi:hypothetical protein
MIATHTQKINGVLHRAGEVIPSPDDKPVKRVVDEIVDDKPKYTKKDITFMKVANLRELAAENGVANPDELTGAELKEILIDKFGL